MQDDRPHNDRRVDKLDLSPRPGDLEVIDSASIDKLRALQTERLRWSARHAYDNVPHYKALFDAARVHVDIKELADLAKLPFTTKFDLRDNYPLGMFAVPREEVSRIHASSPVRQDVLRHLG